MNQVQQGEQLSDSSETESDLETEDAANGYSFVYRVSNHDKSAIQKSKWDILLSVDDQAVNFTIDTAADETVIPVNLYESFGCPILQAPDRVFYGVDKSKLKCLGKFQSLVKTNKQESMQDIYVVEGIDLPLLGRPALDDLKIIKIVNNVQVQMKHPNLFSGIGKLKDNYNIKLTDKFEPYAVNAPRKVSSVPLQKVIKKKLDKLESDGIIFKVDQPTDWCAPMVPVPKRDKEGKINDVRICVDYTKLNQFIKRERYTIPCVNETLSRLEGAKFFSKLDANSWFHQIPLTEDSKLLTTFITPSGRYAFNRMPMGILSAPEHGQKRLSQVLDGMEGVEVIFDDILIHAPTQELHDVRLEEVLVRLERAGITLNKDKCKICVKRVKFVGHIVSELGIEVDPEKVSALTEMTPPKNLPDLRRFLGMVNQFNKFCPKLADLTAPLRELLKKGNSWVWHANHDKAFQTIKDVISQSPCLALYNPNYETKIASDASKIGLGASLFQKQSSGDYQLVFCCSRSCQPAEQDYAPIEREALAVTWACETFSNLLIGLRFKIETDHKALVSLLGRKDLNDIPPRIQRFRIRLFPFDYSISHVPGTSLYITDTLSRLPCQVSAVESKFSLPPPEIASYVAYVLSENTIKQPILTRIQEEQSTDPICKQLIAFSLHGWPNYGNCDRDIKQYYPFKAEINYTNEILLKGSRIIIPGILRTEILTTLHEGHQGITKCRERAKSSVWWPGLSTQIAEIVSKCSTCIHYRIPPVEPMIPSDFPQRPWQKLAADLYEIKNKKYLILIDYYSRYVEVEPLRINSTSLVVISKLKDIFSVHGIPEELRSDNGPQFDSYEFKYFAKAYGFVHTTNSPLYSQSNGEIERAVRTVKNLLKKSSDPSLALMAYRATPLSNGFSPSELLFNRRIRTTLPVMPSQLEPHVPNRQNIRDFEQQSRRKAKQNYDSRHRAKTLPPLLPGSTVYIRDKGYHGQVLEKLPEPRSYLVSTENGILRRNRKFLALCQDHEVDSDSASGDYLLEDLESPEPPDENRNRVEVVPPRVPPGNPGYRTRSGREVRPRDILDL